MDKAKAFVGIDPGKKGFACVLVPEISKVEFMALDNHAADIRSSLMMLNDPYDVQVIMLEKVQNIFGVSSKSNFNFGFNYGWIHGLIESTEIPFDFVRPKIWQAKLGIKPKTPNLKVVIAEHCRRLYPKVNVYGPKGGLIDGKSDSLMLAHYAFQNYGR